LNFLNFRAAKLTWTGAKSSCERKGMKMISMNDPSTREFFLQMLERYLILLLKKPTYGYLI
jgi:hypothetical protein